ncbi:hypothetical protein HPB49_009873 [Dermacentor silvarum]|uniref:Uncharacterized protein n=1 Tax=Dermacentor silvarum TaxID=543639 RepID=A0ACB8C8P4_DERSI|nr:hypothetical protein HPB49_009873 [Dermacentor silvarum]
MPYSALTEANFHYPQLHIEDDPKKQAMVENIVNPLVLNVHTIGKIRDVFKNEIELGLMKNPRRPSSLQMENTYLTELPDGTEKGEFLALDLGGTNFRVLHLQLDPEGDKQFHVKYYSVPDCIRLGPGEKLFDFLVVCIHDFMLTNNLMRKRMPLGFCFSFPMVQKALNVGILVTWTKSFNCDGVVGQDAVQMLKDAINRRGDMDIDIVAVVNETTGTLIENIEKWEGDKTGVREVVIDVEWGAFGDNGVLNFVKTEFDRNVDDNSLLVNSFTFEKLFSGKFLGELVRYVLVKLIRERALFDGQASETIITKGTFTTADVSALEGDDSEGRAREILARIGYLRVTDDDIAVVRYVCGVASARVALLVSICLAELLNRMQKPTVTVAIDGSLYKHHPRFHQLMTEFITVLAPNRPFKLMLAEDGSGKGAGLVAAVADRLRRAKQNGYLK